MQRIQKPCLTSNAIKLIAIFAIVYFKLLSSRVHYR